MSVKACPYVFKKPVWEPIITNTISPVMYQASNCTDDQKHLSLDGANGIGALKVKEIERCLAKELQISVFNDGSNGKLNYQCGADFVKVQQKAPTGRPSLKES